MPSTISLLDRLQDDYPDIVFKKGDLFRWSPEDRIVYYANTSDGASILHEVSHAVLGHKNFAHDIELVQMERNAWDYALSTLSVKYNTPVSQNQAENMLDTYRDWLHDRSLCPNCEATGVQQAPHQYFCLACNSTWTVNEARSCALRRYKQK